MGGENAEFLVDPGASALRTGHIGVGSHEKLEIAAASRAFIFEDRHNLWFPRYSAVEIAVR
jgi:hypothetical protein